MVRETQREVLSCHLLPEKWTASPSPAQGRGAESLTGGLPGKACGEASPHSPADSRPQRRGESRWVACHRFFLVSVWAVPAWSPMVATVPGVFLNQHHFHFGWFVLNAFAVPSGTGRKGLSKKKSGF